MVKVTCRCDHAFEADVPERLDLDQDVERRAALLDGSYLTLACPQCKTSLRPEFPLHVVWPSRSLDLRVVPEIDRADCLSAGAAADGAAALVIGYPELTERVRAASAGLDPAAIEAIKYYLLLKAEESAPEAELSIRFHSLAEGTLEFYLSGLRVEEVAVMKVPIALYQRTLTEMREMPEAEPFASLRFGAYYSVQNVLRPGDGE
jgi:hypothetical protein